MTRILIIHHPDAGLENPYPADTLPDLREAIRAEADLVIEYGGRDLVDEPTMEALDALSDRIAQRAEDALLSRGEYTDPLDIRWTLTTKED